MGKGILVLAGFFGGSVVVVVLELLLYLAGLGAKMAEAESFDEGGKVPATLGGDGVIDLDDVEAVEGGAMEVDSSLVLDVLTFLLLKAIILERTLEDDLGCACVPLSSCCAPESSMDPRGDALDDELGLLALLLLVALSLL